MSLQSMMQFKDGVVYISMDCPAYSMKLLSLSLTKQMQAQSVHLENTHTWEWDAVRTYNHTANPVIPTIIHVERKREQGWS